MKAFTQHSLAIATLLATAACDEHPRIDAAIETIESSEAHQARSAQICDPDQQAAVGGLYYSGWTCADAIANAEASLNSWHYRNACNQQVGSDIGSPVGDATVTNCTIDGGSAVVEVDLCCEPSATVSGTPAGTRKMCIEAGTAAEMLADCEAGAQVNANLYASGYWSTQDYISHWTDPCPAGTSIVPNSQFYVAGSCNALPNVGPGCLGPGSFNYEFQTGVLCQ